MTLTNHTKRIGELVADVIYHADAREYPEAHLAIDDIEARARCLHRHIDNLQLVSDRAARPAGED